MPLQLSDLGLIGDTRTAVLVSRFGSVEWGCFPDFDSPAVFARLLGASGGHFTIAPRDRYTSRQFYEHGTNILVTEFETSTGRIRLRDFMPYVPNRKVATAEIHRVVECAQGHVALRITFSPRFSYGSVLPELLQCPEGVIARTPTGDCMSLASSVALQVDGADATADFELRAGEERIFIADWAASEVHPVPGYQSYRRIWETRKFWRSWIGRLNYHGRYRDAVERSLLTLKLLSYEPTGAIVAAPTTSLPEWIGGSRNWDYRFTWIRDSAFILGAFFRAGYIEEGTAYFDFILQRVFNGDLKILCDIHGSMAVEEAELGNLEGFAGSKPVRVGNGAANQVQLDIYGSLLDAAWLYFEHGGVITSTEWERLREIVQVVLRIWDKPDSGIWEARSAQQHYTYSKVWAWVALDRGARIAERLASREDVAEWQQAAEQIRSTVLERAWNERGGFFAQYFGSDTVDASLLVMPETGFIAATDPRFVRTLSAIKAKLGHPILPVFYRYDTGEFDDGIGEPEGYFLLMSFWYVDALIAQGDLPAARAAIEQLLAMATPIGLYSECIDTENTHGHRFLGNFPQGFSHLGLVNSVFKLDRMRRELEAR